MLTPDKLILIDMLIGRILAIGELIVKVKAMSDKETTESLEAENMRSEQFKNLLESL